MITLVLPYFSVFWPLFGFFSGVCFVCVLFTWFVVIETKDKSKLEVSCMYCPADLDSTVLDATKDNNISMNNI